ncbi:MAG: uracil-DNA glycosylase [Minisyncoccia bacterium]
MQVQIENSWKKALGDEFELPYFNELSRTVREAYLATPPVFPPSKFVFNAFELCPYDSVKVVILGQDPYHGTGQAHGLCFSVQEGVKVPPSLKNIYKELSSDLNIPISNSGNLERWAKQGVLLLNATLTVEANKPGSHQGLGWEQFTDAVIQKISDEKEHVVFLLWGKYAQMKGAKIDRQKHLVLTAPHPSPFSAYTGFLGCKHFSKTNEYLKEHNEITIVW